VTEDTTLATAAPPDDLPLKRKRAEGLDAFAAYAEQTSSSRLGGGVHGMSLEGGSRVVAGEAVKKFKGLEQNARGGASVSVLEKTGSSPTKVASPSVHLSKPVENGSRLSEISASPTASVSQSVSSRPVVVEAEDVSVSASDVNSMQLNGVKDTPSVVIDKEMEGSLDAVREPTVQLNSSTKADWKVHKEKKVFTSYSICYTNEFIIMIL
jgi:hypothetical protein